MSTTNSWNNQIAAANSVITLNSGTNGVAVSTDAAATTVDIAAGGAGAKTLTLGSTNTTSTTNIQSGSGGINIPAFTEGALITSSTGLVTTVTGTAGYVLTANAPGTAPSFQPAPGSGTGNPVLIQSQTASNSATINFTTGITGYTYYILECLGVLPVTNNVDFWLKYSTNAGSTWVGGTAYVYFVTNTNSSANTFSATNNTGTAQFVLSPGNSNNSSYAFYGTMQIFGLATSSSQQYTSSFVTSDSSLDCQQCLGVGYTGLTSVVNGIQVLFSSGNISVGTFRLFGVM